MNKLNIKTITAIGLVVVLLVFCIYFVYFVPRAKYAGKAFTAEILDAIPMDAIQWHGRDVGDMGADLEDEVYNFLSRVFARYYVDSADMKKSVFLIVLDAGNFHYPKVCFRGAGFISEELPQRELNLGHGKLKAHLMLNEKKNEKLLSIYWICIDKKIVPTWAGQKLKQLYYSLFNKERVGLMVRVDIHMDEDMERSVKTGEKFLSDIYQAIPLEYREYIFGGNGERTNRQKEKKYILGNEIRL